jgi:hypothetical protein
MAICQCSRSAAAGGNATMITPASRKLRSSPPSPVGITSKNGGTNLLARRARLANYSPDFQKKGTVRSLPLTAKSSEWAFRPEEYACRSR